MRRSGAGGREEDCLWVLGVAAVICLFHPMMYCSQETRIEVPFLNFVYIERRNGRSHTGMPEWDCSSLRMHLPWLRYSNFTVLFILLNLAQDSKFTSFTSSSILLHSYRTPCLPSISISWKSELFSFLMASIAVFWCFQPLLCHTQWIIREDKYDAVVANQIEPMVRHIRGLTNVETHRHHSLRISTISFI